MAAVPVEASADADLDVPRLLERAQSGGAALVLELTSAVIAAAVTRAVDAPAAVHFAHVVALVHLDRYDEALRAGDDLLRVAERAGSDGWRACALAERACINLLVVDTADGGHDADVVLRDVVRAETVLAAAQDGNVFAAGNAHVGIANAYSDLRLYELAIPHYEAAYAISSVDPGQSGQAAMWQCNLAELHLQWALELYRVGQHAEAEAHSRHAEGHALRAIDDCRDAGTEQWVPAAGLLAACARADGSDPGGAAADIARLSVVLTARDQDGDVAFAAPFHAVAVSRAGRHDEALRMIDAALRDQPADATWMTTAALLHTRAILLGRSAGPEVRATLAYGDLLAGELWQQRTRTLHAARAMRAYESLREQHARAVLAADTDPLTGLLNRRGFDSAVEQWRTAVPDDRVAVILVDVDRFKQINDRAGHACGDRTLHAIAGALARSTRPGDVVARVGGDEFVALLRGVPVTAAVTVATRMLAAVRSEPGALTTVSIGVADGRGADVADAMTRADEAMYRAKRDGGDRVGRDGGR